MARQTIERITCDKCGEDASAYTITRGAAVADVDLCSEHSAGVDELMGLGRRRSTRAARSRSAARPARAARVKRSADVDPAQVREWARANGVPVSKRGRVGADVIEKYLAAR